MLRYFKRLLEKTGYRRSEKRASIILVVLISLLILGRIVFTPGKEKIVSTEPVVLKSELPISRFQEEESMDYSLFRFDPNTVSREQMKELGIPPGQVRMIIKYRTNGGYFRHNNDLTRIYGFDSALFLKLLPFISIDTSAWTGSYRSVEKHIDAPEPAKKINLTDLNNCDSAALEKLPAIGPVLASRIIKYRKLLGGYCRFSQLSEVYGISDSILERIEPFVKISCDSIRMIDLNTAGFKTLARHPYLTRYEVQSILKFRSLTGHIDSVGQLVINGILDSVKARKISPYFTITTTGH